MTEGDLSSDGKGILHPEGMQAARDLAAGVVHEVNNLLGVIIGNAHLAKKNASDTEAVTRYMQELRDAAEEGRELMRHLGILAGSEPMRPRELSLHDLVTHASSGLGTPVERDFSREDLMVRIDVWLAQDALRSVFRFMADTTAVSSIRAATRVVGPAVALTIEDDGGTLSDTELRMLFAPFAKANRRPKSGLGFTKVADLASRSGGHVVASNREPSGLRIVLTLPLASRSHSGDGPGVPLAE